MLNICEQRVDRSNTPRSAGDPRRKAHGVLLLLLRAASGVVRRADRGLTVRCGQGFGSDFAHIYGAKIMLAVPLAHRPSLPLHRTPVAGEGVAASALTPLCAASTPGKQDSSDKLPRPANASVAAFVAVLHLDAQDAKPSWNGAHRRAFQTLTGRVASLWANMRAVGATLPLHVLLSGRHLAATQMPMSGHSRNWSVCDKVRRH